MGQVSELVGSMCFGLADIITDGIAYARMDGDVAFPNDGYKAAYTAILCFGVVTTALSLAYRLQNVRIMREHVHKLDKSYHSPQRQANRGNDSDKAMHITSVNESFTIRESTSKEALKAEASRVSAARRQMQQHEWELAQTHRAKVILSLTLLNVAAQGATASCVSCAHVASSFHNSIVTVARQVCRCPLSTARCSS